MLSNQASSSNSKVTPHLLPCRIAYTGPANASQRYWNVEHGADDKKTAYFRGRKLVGREVKIQKGYKGVAVQTMERVTQNPASKETKFPPPADTDSDDEIEMEQEQVEKAQNWEEVATFDEIMVWDHENLPGDEDLFVRGVEEWIQFAEAINSVEDEEVKDRQL